MTSNTTPPPTSKQTPIVASKKLIRMDFPRDWTAQQIADHIKKVQAEAEKK